MDETNTRWFEWIAEHARYFFWGVWGAAAGAFGLIIFKAVDMTGITTPIYLGFLTVAMSAMAGFVSSRGMDRLADQRATGRKINVAVMRMRLLAYELFELHRLLQEMMAAAPTIPPRAYAQHAARSTRVGLAAITLPDFDAIIGSRDDIFPATQITSTFRTIQTTFPTTLPNDADARTLIEHMLDPQPIEGLKRHVELLTKVAAHFESRILG